MKPGVYVPKHGVHLFDKDEFNKERDYVRLEYLFRLKEKLRDDTDLNKLLKNGVITGDEYAAIKNAIEKYIKSDIEPKITMETIKKETGEKTIVEIVNKTSCHSLSEFEKYLAGLYDAGCISRSTYIPQSEKRRSRIEKFFTKKDK